MNDDRISDAIPQDVESRRVLRLFSWRTLKFIILTLAAVLIVGAIYLNVWVGSWVEQRLTVDGPTPQKLEWMEAFWETTIDYSPEWLAENTSQTLSDAYKAVVETGNRIRKENASVFQRIEQRARQIGISYSPQQWEEFEADIETVSSYIEAIQNLSDLLQQESQSCQSSYEFPDYSDGLWNSYKMIQTLQQKALLLIHFGKTAEAIEVYLSTFPLNFCNPAKDCHFYRVRMSRIADSIMPIQSLLNEFDNRRLLQGWLERLNDYAPLLFADVGDRGDTFSLLTELYSYRQYTEFISDNAPGKKAAYYIDQIASLYSNQISFGESVMNCVDAVLTSSNIKKQHGELSLANLVRPFIFTSSLDRLMRIRITPSSEKLRIQQEEQKVAPQYDVLRLSVAARLYELETGKKVTATADLVPTYFEEEIVVYPSGASFQWDAEGKPIEPMFQ